MSKMSRLVKLVQRCLFAGLFVFGLLALLINTWYVVRSGLRGAHIQNDKQQAQAIPVVRGPTATEGKVDPASKQKLEKIELLLMKLNQKLEEQSRNPNFSAVVKGDLKTVRELFRQVHGSDDVLSGKFYMEGFLEQPMKPWPEPPKMKLNDMEYMRDPNYKTPECPRTIVTKTRYSKWFRDRYIPDIKLFLEPSDVNSYEKYYKLSHYILPFGFSGIARDKFGRIVNNVNYTKSSVETRGKRSKCMRCAVIGCGGVLNGSNAGEEIDNHDYVFRVNHAYSSGVYAKDAGTKTSFYTFFPESQHAECLSDTNVSFFYTMFKAYDVDYGISLMEDQEPPIYTNEGKKYKRRKPKVDNQRTRSIHPDFFRYIFTRFLDSKSYRPTTGAVVVLLAIHMCDEVNIYGFGYDSRFTLHYDKKFVAHTNKSTGSHDVKNERLLWGKLHESGVIRWFKRDE